MNKNLAVNVVVSAVVTTITGAQVKAERPVTIIQSRPGFVMGYVGNAHYWWEPKKYSLPTVVLDGKRHYGDYICQMVKDFLLAWKEAIKSNTKTVVCYEEHPEADREARKAAKHAENYISGHPLWLTRIKKPVKCVMKKTGLVYESYRRVPVEYKSLIDSHVSLYCCKCPFRAGCEKPCSNPVDNSAKEVIVQA